MDAHTETIRAERARQILEDPIVKEAFAAIEERVITGLSDVDIAPERRERLQLLLALGRKYRVYWEQMVATGKMNDIDELRKRSFIDRFKQNPR